MAKQIKKTSKTLVGRTTPRKKNAEGKAFRGPFKPVNEAGLNAWNTGKKMTFHGVRAGGRSFDSLYQAFKALRLPIGAHKAFRKALKAEGTQTWDRDGKKIKFTAVAAA